LTEELAETRSTIKSYENSIVSNEKKLAALEDEKRILDELIVTKEGEIAATEAALAAKGVEISDKREVIYGNDQLLRQRLVAIYTMNNANAMAQLLSVESFGELMRLLDGMRRISKHDTDLLDRLETQRIQLEAEQKEIDALLLTLNADYEEMLAWREEKVQNIMATDQALTYAQAQKVAFEDLEEAQYAELVAAQEDMRRIQNSLGGSRRGDGSVYVGGVFTWPVPGHFNITCHFGAPDPNGRGHRGMDISAPIGTPIVACGEGMVIVASYAGGSYGNYVVIDHGDGVKSLYAHCSELWVSVGTYVKQKQSIAAVGSTGFSTGPHLHLEVQTGGGLEDPGKWLKA
jgi:murein DD-endopeptidase MepM/ murein hydrolase activator NlpD